LSLFLRFLPTANAKPPSPRAVLYIHGGTFPSAVSIAHRFDGGMTMRWLFDAFTAAPVKRDVKIGRGTHLMHLESMRLALWRESIDFLTGDDVAPVP
jgi:hypothetical protein